MTDEECTIYDILIRLAETMREHGGFDPEGVAAAQARLLRRRLNEWYEDQEEK